MRIKRYVAPEMREAIRAVRDELGPDAVILSNREVDGGVEIVAAHDLDESFAAEETTIVSPSPRARASSAERPTEFDPDRHAPPAIPSEPEPREVRRLEDEIRHLRDLIEDQLSSLAWGDFGRRQPARASVFRRLIALGIGHNLAADLARNATPSSEPRLAWQEVLRGLGDRITLGQRDLLNHGGRIAFIGPTGVGKTTTIAKVAARFSMRFGPESVALITTDPRTRFQKSIFFCEIPLSEEKVCYISSIH
ncbi:MAG: flagellar biosynthesis protein FlhF, partial [Pseudomonadota bacterium]